MNSQDESHEEKNKTRIVSHKWRILFNFISPSLNKKESPNIVDFNGGNISLAICHSFKYKIWIYIYLSNIYVSMTN